MNMAMNTDTYTTQTYPMSVLTFVFMLMHEFCHAYLNEQLSGHAQLHITRTRTDMVNIDGHRTKTKSAESIKIFKKRFRSTDARKSPDAIRKCKNMHFPLEFTFK
jgi:hypothetical protein